MSTADGHEHGEAFRHMRYGTKDRRIVRWVWNSRDGVTPFGFTDPETGEELTHLGPWTEDAYEPDFRPQPGDLVFIDLHPEKALKLAQERVELFWDHPTMPMRDAGRTKEEWARIFWEESMFFTDPKTGEKIAKGEPDLIVWDVTTERIGPALADGEERVEVTGEELGVDVSITVVSSPSAARPGSAGTEGDDRG